MSNSVTVRRANVLLDVPMEQKDEYLSKGFDVIDDKGNIVAEATMTNDVSTLKKKLAEAHEKIRVLEEENIRLNKELDEIANEDLENEDLETEPAKKTKKKSSDK